MQDEQIVRLQQQITLQEQELAVLKQHLQELQDQLKKDIVYISQSQCMFLP